MVSISFGYTMELPHGGNSIEYQKLIVSEKKSISLKFKLAKSISHIFL